MEGLQPLMLAERLVAQGDEPTPPGNTTPPAPSEEPAKGDEPGGGPGEPGAQPAGEPAPVATAQVQKEIRYGAGFQFRGVFVPPSLDS